MTQSKPFCADLSRENDEPLAATASRIDRWILVEYRTLWTRDALAGSGLSDQVKAHLRAQVRSLENCRLLFIRRPDRRHAPTLLAYAVDSRAGNELIRCVEVENHDDLRHVDLTASRAGHRLGHPLFVVCTHGKHDPCCARYGRPLFDAVQEEVDPDWVWQTTHVGGDRFAGNLVCLPEGAYYGRVERTDAGAVVDEHLARRVLLRLYRGRSTQAFAVQAAERAVREATGLTGLDDLEVRGVEESGGIWHVRLAHGDVEYSVDARPAPGDLTYLTCSMSAVKRPMRYVAAIRPR